MRGRPCNGDVREHVDEAFERCVDRHAAALVGQKPQGMIPDAGITLFAIEATNIMEDFIDQPHRVDLAGPDGALGEADDVAFVVIFLAKTRQA